MRKAYAKFAGASADSLLRRYIGTLISVMSWKVALALGLMICVSLTEGVGLLLLAPLLQVVGVDVQQGTVGRITDFVTSVFTTVGMRPTLLAVLGLYVLVVGTQAFLGRWQTIFDFTFQQEFLVHLRERLYKAIANSNWLFFSRSRASDFTHALTNELERVNIATNQLLSLFATAVVTAIYILLAVALSPTMTGLVFACGAVLLLLLRGKTRATREIGKGLSRETRSLYAAASEHLTGMKTVKSYGAQDRNVALFSRLTERVAQTYIDMSRRHAEAKSWLDIGSVLILSLMVYISIELLAIPTGGLLLLLYLFARIVPSLSSLQQSYQEFVAQLPAFTTVMEMQDRCEAAAEPKPVRYEGIELGDGIRFEEVSFAYEERGEPFVISDLDLTIRAGETTAIVGPSGAGKSTIADLVMGLILPAKGRVLVDEAPLRAEQMRAWRSQIGYVTQDAFLFHDTVRANLLWACPEASDEEIREALRLAAAEDFVSRLSEGMETVLGDRGVRLSGGERQRLALARALLRKPSLLILDEATSNLDSENERRIQGAIEKLHGSMTILIITHRLFTIRSADVIHVLERGRLVESGDSSTLIARENGRFLALCKAQSIDTGTPLES
ncbi:MAG: ABC transporter ATP-binding protein [Rubrobacter sp.]|nr:ABC transporter ATP-binding protein [Rubrobacter sp.]